MRICRRRGAIAPDHSANSTRLEKDRAATLALVFADTLRREVIRDYGHVYEHPVPIYALVYWADTGEVYALLPSWRFWDQEDERYEAMMPKGSRIVGGQRAHVRSDI